MAATEEVKRPIGAIGDPINYCGDSFWRIAEMVTYRGQGYWKIGTRIVERQDGGFSELPLWESVCAECGARFEFLKADISRGPNRRCPEHSKPLKPVERRQRKKSKK